MKIISSIVSPYLRIFLAPALSFILVFILLFNCSSPVAAKKHHSSRTGSSAAASDSELKDAIAEDFSSYEYENVIDKYNKLTAEQQKDPETSYLAGFCFLRVHDFISADKALRIAKEGKFEAWDAFPSVEQLLDRVETMKSLCPPPLSLNDADIPIAFYAQPTEWFDSIKCEFPNFIKRAKEIYGDNLPPITLYVFTNREDYDKFFFAMFEHKPTEGQDATGMKGVVLLCEKTAEGSTTGRQLSFRHGVVLHEYSHALCSTIWGLSYRQEVPCWLDEAIADEVSKLYYANVFRWYDINLRSASKRKDPPSYEDLKSGKQEDRYVYYAFSRHMLLELLGDEEADDMLIRRMLERAKTYKWNYDKAIYKVTGLKPSQAYKRVVKRFWSQPKVYRPHNERRITYSSSLSLSVPA